MTTEPDTAQNRRRSERVSARIRVLFTREGTGVAIEAETDDISVDGVFVRTNRRPPEVGTRLGLLLKLEDPAPEMMVKGIVARVTEEPSQGMGIRFVELDDATRAALKEALEGN